MSECACPGCNKPAKSLCSVCHRGHYCSGDCQKLDWKAHKIMCPILKKLVNKLLPFHEVFPMISGIQGNICGKILGDTLKGYDIRIFEHLLSYVEYQSGKEISGIDYRERGNGERINNHEVDNVVNLIFDQLNAVTSHLVAVASERGQFDLAEGNCQRFLAYSKKFGSEGEKKTTMIFKALSLSVSVQETRCNYSNAVTFAEEGYNLVVEAYNPAHPQVQEAAGVLINILIVEGHLFDAGSSM